MIPIDMYLRLLVEAVDKKNIKTYTRICGIQWKTIYTYY